MKFSKDSVEWGIFGAVWKFYQEFYDPVDDDLEKYIDAVIHGMSEILKPLEGQPQYSLAKNMFHACAMDLIDRAEERMKR